MNFYTKKILFFFSFLFFISYAVEDSNKINELLCNLADEAGEEFDAFAILDVAIGRLLTEQEYGWSHGNLLLNSANLKAITMDYFAFHDSEISKNPNIGQESIKRKFLDLEETVSVYKGKVTIGLLTFLEKAYHIISNRVEANKLSNRKKKFLNQGFFSKTKALFSSLDTWREKNNNANPYFKFFINNGEAKVSGPTTDSVVNIHDELIKFKDRSEFCDAMKKKVYSGHLVLQCDHLENYDYEQLENLERILQDIKGFVKNNVTILCHTNFSDIAALYKKIFVEKQSGETLSYEADSFVSTDSFFSHSGHVYLYPQNKAPFSLSSLENLDQSHKIYFFIDSVFDKKQYELFVEEMKKKNRSFSLECIPVFQNNIKDKEEFQPKRIPSFFEELTGSERGLWHSLRQEEQNAISLIARRNKIDFREWKKLFGVARNFNDLKDNFLQLFSKKYGTSCDFLQITSQKEINQEQDKKSSFWDASLVYFQNTGIHVFPAEKVKNEVLAYVQKDSSAGDILIFDFLSDFRQFSNISADSPDDIKQILKNKAKENVEKVKSIPVFNTVKKYNFIDAYALKVFLKEKIGPELSSLYRSRERDSGEFESKVEQDLDEIYNKIIQEIVGNKSSVPVLFVGPKKSLNDKNIFIVKDFFSSHDALVKKLFHEDNISKEFSLKILTQFPIPHYFSLEEKEKLIKFASAKFNHYKILNSHEREKLFFEDESVTQELMTEIFRVIELLPLESNLDSIQDIIDQNQRMYTHLFFKPNQSRENEELKKVNLQEENKQIFSFLFQKTKKRFFIEDIQKIRFILKSLGIFGEDRINILDAIFSDKKNYNLKEKDSAEITSFVLSNLYYSFLEKTNTSINYKVAGNLNQFFSILSKNHNYDSSVLHSQLKSYINEQFSMFKQDRSNILLFNVGGATGVGKTEGINEVRSQLAEIVGDDPIVIKVENTVTKWQGSNQENLGHLYDLTKKFIKQGKYVILFFDEVDKFVGQSSNQNSTDAARDAKNSSDFKTRIDNMKKEFGSRIVFYSASNHRMIIQGEKNQFDNKENQAIVVEDAIIRRFGTQLWLPYVEQNQFNFFSKKILAQKKQINAYPKSAGILDQTLKRVSDQKAFNEPFLQSCINNVFFPTSDSKNQGLEEINKRISLFLQQLEDAEKNYSIEKEMRAFACEENKKKFKESMNSVWKSINNLDNLTQVQQQKKTGQLVGGILGGAISFLGGTEHLPQWMLHLLGEDKKKREYSLGALKDTLNMVGSGYDNMQSPEQERQNLAVRSDKVFIKSLLVNNTGESLDEKVNNICALYFQRLRTGNYNKNGELTISETDTINDFIFKEVYGVPLKKKVVTNGVELRTWITFEKIKSKLPNIDSVLKFLDKEKKEYYLAKMLDTISPEAAVNKDFAKKRLTSIDNYFASEINKKEFKVLIEDDLQAKINFTADSLDGKKLEEINKADRELFTYLKILNANATIKNVEKKIKDNEGAFNKLFTKGQTDSLSKL